VICKVSFQTFNWSNVSLTSANYQKNYNVPLSIKNDKNTLIKNLEKNTKKKERKKKSIIFCFLLLFFFKKKIIRYLYSCEFFRIIFFLYLSFCGTKGLQCNFMVLLGYIALIESLKKHYKLVDNSRELDMCTFPPSLSIYIHIFVGQFKTQ
jgi:hypothetical protein